MENDVVVPKQEREVCFDSDNWENAKKLKRICSFFKLQEIVEIEPISEKFVVYDEHIEKYLGPGSKSDFEKLKTKWLNGLISDVEYVTLPEVARLIVKNDITIEQFFENLNYDNWFPALEYFAKGSLDELFENVMQSASFKEELLARIEGPTALNSAKTITATVVGEQPGQELELELLVTKLFGWNFVRLASVKYNTSKFEYFLNNPTGKNIYRANSTDVGSLRRDFCLAFARGHTFPVVYGFIKHFLQFYDQQIIINEEMILRLKARYLDKQTNQLVFNASFKVFEPDYTVFLE
jgi:hypothetical protein